MGRAPREIVAGGTYHVYSRGSNRQAIFAFDSDRIDFLGCLDRVVGRSEISCLAYCLMSNHYHLVLVTHDGQLSRAIHALNSRYANRFNHRYERDAHLFKNRFGATTQRTKSQLLWTLRYTAMNPVESGLCSGPDDWRWSSYRASARIDPAPRFLDVNRLWSLFQGMDGKGPARYRNAIHGIVGA